MKALFPVEIQKSSPAMFEHEREIIIETESGRRSGLVNIAALRGDHVEVSVVEFSRTGWALVQFLCEFWAGGTRAHVRADSLVVVLR